MEELPNSDSGSRKHEYSHFNRTLRALFKKSFLIKIRKPMSIVEIVIATVLWIVLYPCWKIARKDSSGNQYPGLGYTTVIPSPLASVFVSSEDVSFVVGPDCNNTRTLLNLINQSMILSIAITLNMANEDTNTTNSTNTTSAQLLSSDTKYYSNNDFNLDLIQGKLTPEMNNFVDKYARNIIQGITDELQSYKKINLEDSEFEDYIKLSAIEGIISFYHYGEDQFDFEDFMSRKIREYLNSILTPQNILRLKLKIIDDDGEVIDDPPSINEADSIYDSNFRDYTAHFNHKILSIINSKSKPNDDEDLQPKQQNFLSRMLNKFSFRENSQVRPLIDFNWTNPEFINLLFPGAKFNPDDFDSNYTYNFIQEYYHFDPIIVDNAREIQSKIYDHMDMGVGIFWKNAKNETEATIEPVVQTYYQSFGGNPSSYLFELLIRLISYMNEPEGITVDIAYDEYQAYPHPSGERMYDISILVGIIVIFPVVIASMSDLQLLLEEKDNHVMVLSFLMGCSETAYFMVNMIMQFMSSLPAYIIMCAFFCYVFIFKGTSFTLMLVISILFVMSHIAFLMFLTTFMKKAAMGRIITVLFLVISVFFAFIHFFYTLDENNNSNVAKHIFSIVPLSCYELAMMSMYQVCRASLPPVGWSTIRNSPRIHMNYQMWYALMWLPIDFVFYFLLFLLFNLTMSRNFGSPPIKWKELFKKKAWKRLTRKRKTLGLTKKGTSVLYDTNTQLFDNQLLKVENLSKVYHGHKKVTALSDVNFSINQNEVIIVIGPNGAGKSTLINIVCGALQPTTGTLRLFKEQPTENFSVIQDILGVCFQDNVIVEKLSIEENFELFGAFRDISDEELHKTMDFFAETLQLSHMMKTRTGDLSGGQKRKVCISLSLLGNPPLVIMDEPTAGVDVQARQLIWKVIASLKNTTTIITSHALEEAEAVSTRLFVVAGGTLPFAGTATEFRNTFKCGYILRVEGCDVGSNRAKDQVVTVTPNANSSGTNVFTIQQGVSPEDENLNINDIKIEDGNNATLKRRNNAPNARRRNKKINPRDGLVNGDDDDNLEDIDDDDNNNNNNQDDNDISPLAVTSLAEERNSRKNSSHIVFLSDDNNEGDPDIKASEITKPKARPKFNRARMRSKKDDESENENKIFESKYYNYSSSDDDDNNIFDANQNESSGSYSEMAANRVLQMIKQFEPKARISRERVDSIRLPVSKNVPRIMNEIEAHKAELGVVSYSISVEQLEDVLLKMIMTEEASFNRTND